MPVDIIIDYETAAAEQDRMNESAVLELGAVAFEHTPESGAIPDFEEMVDNGFRVKFELRSQLGRRLVSADTINWWKRQNPEARKVLIPDPNIDVSVEVGHKRFVNWLQEVGVSRGSQIWCRGNSFDFPILFNCLHEAGITETHLPGFWNQRDVRTRIEAMLGRGKTECPLPIGTLPGFIHHNGLHDCAKDVMMLTYSYRYAFGLDELPEREQCEPASLPKR